MIIPAMPDAYSYDRNEYDVHVFMEVNHPDAQAEHYRIQEYFRKPGR
jgi:hypothetical protein